MKELLFYCPHLPALRVAATGVLAAYIVTGCASVPPLSPNIVLVPTGCRAASERPPRPVLPISGLSAADEPSFVVKAYAASVEVLKGYGESLELLLDSCK